MSDDRFLQVRGEHLVDRHGTRVVLRGYNAGGWMNMENFITGFPGTESLQRDALLRTLGRDRYELFFHHFMEAFFNESDVRYMASLGFNAVRIPFHYRHFESDDEPFVLKEEGFALLDRAVEDCARHGLYTILDMHTLPGHHNPEWHSDNPTHVAGFWQHRHFQDRAVHLWEALADRYRDQPWVAGYNVMNEPAEATGRRLKAFYDRAVDAIRAIDAHHVIFLDGNRAARDFDLFEGAEVYANTVYSAHDYRGPGFLWGGPYPGITNGRYFDRDEVERAFLERCSYMRETGTPIWIGEFGPLYSGEVERDEQRYRFLRDQLDVYRQYGASWSMWTYKDVGLHGLVSAAADSAWMERIGWVIAKKHRLGTDSWGTLDTDIRHVLGPIEELFAQEFPDFDPFPAGSAGFIRRLVRHILLAEPMVEDFAGCFADLDDASLIAMADSFRLENCVRREPLERLLAAAAATADQPQGPSEEG